jgi:hypothetical protein
VLGPQWQPGDTTGVLAPQWTPPTVPGTATVDTTASPGASDSSLPQNPEVQAAVAAQVGVTEAAYDTALRNPADPSLITVVEAATVDESPARAEFVGAYNTVIGAGHWAAADPDVPNSVTVEADPFIDRSGTEAHVIVCHVSGDTLMGRDEDGVEVVLADSRNARLILQTFRLVDSTWRLFERVQLAIIPEGTSCEGSVTPSSSSVASSVP